VIVLSQGKVVEESQKGELSFARPEVIDDVRPPAPVIEATPEEGPSLAYDRMQALVDEWRTRLLRARADGTPLCLPAPKTDPPPEEIAATRKVRAFELPNQAFKNESRKRGKRTQQARSNGRDKEHDASQSGNEPLRQRRGAYPRVRFPTETAKD
jgi:hypothetical protein